MHGSRYFCLLFLLSLCTVSKNVSAVVGYTQTSEPYYEVFEGTTWCGISIICTRTDQIVPGEELVSLYTGVLVREKAEPPTIRITGVSQQPLFINDIRVEFTPVDCSDSSGNGPCEINEISPPPEGTRWVSYQSTNRFPRVPDSELSFNFLFTVPSLSSSIERKIWFTDNADDLYDEPVTDLLASFFFRGPVGYFTVLRVKEHEHRAPRRGLTVSASPAGGRAELISRSKPVALSGKSWGYIKKRLQE